MKISAFIFENISKEYDDEVALDNFSYTFNKGKNTAILGLSGSGKSTLLRIFSGLLAPNTGKLKWEQTILSEKNTIIIPPHQRNLGMVFQDLGLWPNLSVFENIEMGLYHSIHSKQGRESRVHEICQLCQIESLIQRKPTQISGGQQQRVAIARAIAVQPEFLLFDEPFSGLDLVTKTLLMQEIKTLLLSLDITLILVTHDPSEARWLCDDLIVLNQGKVEESGTISGLFENPQSNILKIYNREFRGVP